MAAARSMAFGRTVAVRVVGRRFSREELRAGGSPHVGFSITLLLAGLFFDLRFHADCCYFLVGIFGKGSSVFSILCRPAVFSPAFSLVPVVFLSLFIWPAILLLVLVYRRLALGFCWVDIFHPLIFRQIILMF